MTRDERRVQYKCAILAGDLAHPETGQNREGWASEYYAAWVGALADALIEEDSQCK